MLTVTLATESAPAIHKAGIEQFDDRSEVGIEPIMGSCSKEQEAIGLLRQNLGQASALRVFPVTARTEADAVMGLVDNYKIPHGSFQFLEHFFLLRKVDRGQTEG